MTTWWRTAGRPTAARVIVAVGRQPLVPVALAGLIVLVDRAMRRASSRLEIGLLDEPGHLATAALVLLAVVGGRRLGAAPAFTLSALACSTLIDIDHVPLYAGVPGVAEQGGRPYSHSLATVLVLLVVWLVSGRRWTVAAGAAAGVALHFVRDVATGPGLPLWWPVTADPLRYPYRWYLGVVVGLAVVAAVRASLARRRSPAAPE